MEERGFNGESGIYDLRGEEMEMMDKEKRKGLWKDVEKMIEKRMVVDKMDIEEEEINKGWKNNVEKDENEDVFEEREKDEWRIEDVVV